MDLRVLGTSLLLLTALALLGYGFHDAIDAVAGVKASPLDSAAQSIAIALGASILVSLCYPHVRGVRKGDAIVASVPRAHATAGGMFAFIDSISAVALEGGRLGQKIKVRLGNGRDGEGIIQSYAGAFSPPSVQITETETG